MTRRTLLAALVALATASLTALPAAALSLQEAKAQGLVGEQADGYLGVVGSGPPEARQLAKKVNGKRRKEYAAIAEKRGTSTEAVAALAGQKLVQRTPKGQYVRGSDGSWKRK